ncbi:MAG: hypothetical protein J6Z35_04605, partial [Lachnospiraceae bacterium]|nr:hypothetical protein [Lachnospiraceae bacterium]
MNNGTMIINGGSFGSGSGSATAVYVENGSLTLDGKVTASLYTPTATALADSFSAESQVALYLDAYTADKLVLTGSDTVVGAA